MRYKKGLASILMTLFVLSGIPGQIPHSQVVFAYLGLAVDSAQLSVSLRDTDFQVLENRIKGSLLDIARQENYSIASPQNASSVLNLLQQRKTAAFQEELLGFSSSLTANGVLVFRLDADANNLMHLRALMYSVPGGETVVDSVEAASGLDQMLSRIPGLVYGLFGLLPPAAAGDRSAGGNGNRNTLGAFSRDRDLVLKDVTGIWQGDYDQAKVEIHQDGSGLIWLNASDTMKIKVSVSGQTVYVRQDEPNSPKLYLSVFPYTIATQVVRLARPMSWEFRVTQERDRMIGKKDTSYFYIEQSKIIQVDNTYSRDAVWTRMP